MSFRTCAMNSGFVKSWIRLVIATLRTFSTSLGSEPCSFTQSSSRFGLLLNVRRNQERTSLNSPDRVPIYQGSSTGVSPLVLTVSVVTTAWNVWEIDFIKPWLVSLLFNLWLIYWLPFLPVWLSHPSQSPSIQSLDTELRSEE